MTSTAMESGSRFGKLTAIAYAGRRNKKALWSFLCECGKYKDIAASDVRAGRTSSCGCLHKAALSARTAADLLGMSFGRLRVLERLSSTASGKVRWRCACACGAETITNTGALRSGNTASCGCYASEASAKRVLSRKHPDADERNRKRRRAYEKRRMETPEYALRKRLSHALRRALRLAGTSKTEGTLQLLGFTREELVSHIERQFVKGMGWHNMSEWHIDHIVPISTAKTPEEVIALNDLSNLRPLWATANNAKRAARVFLI